MIIDFDSMETTVSPNFKGGEKEYCAEMFFDGTNRIMRGLLHPGASIGKHVHEGNCEVIFVTSGSGTVIDDGVTVALHKGQCHYCPEGHEHSLINTGDTDLTFFAVVAKQ